MELHFVDSINSLLSGSFSIFFHLEIPYTLVSIEHTQNLFFLFVLKSDYLQLQ